MILLICYYDIKCLTYFNITLTNELIFLNSLKIRIFASHLLTIIMVYVIVGLFYTEIFAQISISIFYTFMTCKLYY